MAITSIQWLGTDNPAKLDCNAANHDNANTHWTVSLSYNTQESNANFRFLNQAKLSSPPHSKAAFLRFDLSHAGKVDIKGGGGLWTYAQLENVGNGTARIYCLNGGNPLYLAVTQAGHVISTRQKDDTTLFLIQEFEEIYVHSVMSHGGVSTDIPLGNEEWVVNSVLVNGSVVQMDGSRCAMDKKGKQLFCAFSTRTLGPISDGTKWDIIMDKVDGSEQRNFPIQMFLPQGSVAEVTVHLLFDRYEHSGAQTVRVFLLPEKGTTQWRTRPMGIVNSGSTCYMNALVQSLVASLGIEIKTEQRFSVNDADSMMMVEILRTYLNLDWAHIITEHSYKFYVTVLVDFVGNKRGDMYDTMEQFLDEHIGAVTVIRKWIKHHDLPPKLLTLATAYSEPAPPVSVWNIPRNKETGAVQAMLGSDISTADLYDLSAGKHMHYSALMAKVQFEGPHLTAKVRWGQAWFNCDDKVVDDITADAGNMGHFAGTDVGLFHRQTNPGPPVDIHEGVREAAEGVRALAFAAAVARARENILQRRAQTAEAAIAGVLAGVSRHLVTPDEVYNGDMSGAIPAEFEVNFEVETFDGDTVAIRVRNIRKCIAAVAGDEIVGVELVDCSADKVKTQSAMWKVHVIGGGSEEFMLENVELTGKYLRFNGLSAKEAKDRGKAAVDGNGGGGAWNRMRLVKGYDEGGDVCMKCVHFSQFLAIEDGETIIASAGKGREGEFEVIGNGKDILRNLM